MNLKSEDLNELATISLKSGSYFFDVKLTNGISVESYCTYYHDLYGWQALIQVWDPRDKMPFWRICFIDCSNYKRVTIIKTYPKDTWQSGNLPYVEVAEMVARWRKTNSFDELSEPSE
jgi:hypothetical protein